MSKIVKAALITGGAKRVGREIALHLAKCGWSIAIHYNSSDSQALDTKNDIIAAGAPSSCIVKADFSNKGQVEGVIAEASSKLDGAMIKLLVNNASVFENDNFRTLNSDSWEKHFRVNLDAPLWLCKSFFDYVSSRMNDEREGGSDKGAKIMHSVDQDEQDCCVINLLDRSVLCMERDFFSYNMSKQSLLYMTKMAAKSMAPLVRVNGIAPGMIMKNDRQSEDHFNRARSSTLMGADADVIEICKAISYIASARSMTGGLLVLDGGMHLM